MPPRLKYFLQSKIPLGTGHRVEYRSRNHMVSEATLLCHANALVE